MYFLFSPNFPEESFNLWLHYSASCAPKADIVLLNITSNAESADEVVLTPFQAINPNFRGVISVTADYRTMPATLINQLRKVCLPNVRSLSSQTKCCREPLKYVISFSPREKNPECPKNTHGVSWTST